MSIKTTKKVIIPIKKTAYTGTANTSSQSDCLGAQRDNKDYSPNNKTYNTSSYPSQGYRALGNTLGEKQSFCDGTQTQYVNDKGTEQIPAQRNNKASAPFNINEDIIRSIAPIPLYKICETCSILKRNKASRKDMGTQTEPIGSECYPLGSTSKEIGTQTEPTCREVLLCSGHNAMLCLKQQQPENATNKNIISLNNINITTTATLDINTKATMNAENITSDLIDSNYEVIRYDPMDTQTNIEDARRDNKDTNHNLICKEEAKHKGRFTQNSISSPLTENASLTGAPSLFDELQNLLLEKDNYISQLLDKINCYEKQMQII